MDLPAVWEYFGSFDHREMERIFVMVMFIIGTLLVLGITALVVEISAKFWVWAIYQLRFAFRHYDEISADAGKTL